jgi:hypothetical protein
MDWLQPRIVCLEWVVSLQRRHLPGAFLKNQPIDDNAAERQKL